MAAESQGRGKGVGSSENNKGMSNVYRKDIRDEQQKLSDEQQDCNSSR